MYEKPLHLCSLLLPGALIAILTSCGTNSGTTTSSSGSQSTPVIVSFTATPSSVPAGQLSTLNWTTTHAQSVAISPDPTGAGESQPLGTSGTVAINPTTTTTYTLTATGTSGQTASATTKVTVSAVTLTISVSPANITAGQTATLTWQASSGVTSLSIDNGVCSSCAIPTGSALVSPTTSTTYTATASTAGGPISQTAMLTVSPSTQTSALKHILFMLQENRSFDDYFGMLGPYRAQRLSQFGIPASSSDINGLDCTDDTCSNITLYTRSDSPIPNAAVHPFHYVTACIENLTPSWDETHYDVHLTGTTWSATTQPGWTVNPAAFKMDNFLQTTTSITQVNANDDPSGTRPMGYYTQADLPYYYDLATFFGTSDTWFSPMMANTIPNRMYMFAATSFGHAFPDPPPSTGFSVPTIFKALTNAGVSWRYYYQDNSVFLAQFSDYLNNATIRGNVVPVQQYYNILQGNCGGQACDADTALPQVVFIERAGSTGLDEHPDFGSNNQEGAAVVQKLISALMSSTAWKSSAFILTFDEAGGLYDHVPPVQVPLPDSYAPGQCPDSGTCRFSSSDAQATFNLSGMRLPLMVISPWAKPHYVSHTPRDLTAILALIEKNFGVPSLTKRDAYFIDPSRDMYEFFDFSNPALLNAPNGSSWSTFLPQQPTNLPCDPSLGKAPGY